MKWLDYLLEFKAGDPTWKGANTAAENSDIDKAVYRKKWKQIKDALMKDGMPIEQAIPIAHATAKKFFRGKK